MLTIYKIGARFQNQKNHNEWDCTVPLDGAEYAFSAFGVITDTNRYHFEQKAVHINRRYLVPMLNLQCAQIKIILISPMFEFHRRNKFDQDTKDMQLEATFMSSLKMYFWIFPPDINNIVLWREREREQP